MDSNERRTAEMADEQMIPVYRPHFTGREKIYVNECLESSWISSRGSFIGKFEQAFKSYTGIAHATSVCNGTVALHLALVTLGIGPGDEVIVPSLTYVASVNTILQVGAQPVYVDSLADTWQLDPIDVLRKITPRTRAVMAVHLYGLPCAMDVLTHICGQNGLFLIEDCAEGFGSSFDGRHVGTFGDVGTFSFFGNKTITTGEGGMVVFKDGRLAERAASLKSQGVSKEIEYWHTMLAFNYRMTNICAAIGLAQIESATEILSRKRALADVYRQGLAGLPLVFHDEVPGTVHSYWMCSIAVTDAADRNPLRERLRRAGIETRPLFFPAHRLPHCAAEISLPVAEGLSARGINLPSFPDLTERDIHRVCGEIRDWFGARS